MATKKAGGSTSNGRDSVSKRRGIKRFGGQPVKAGEIIVRQKGTKWHPGLNVGVGGDFTLYALVSGIVHYTQKRRVKFDGNTKKDTLVHILAA